jgi:hypothetical protein
MEKSDKQIAVETDAEFRAREMNRDFNLTIFSLNSRWMTSEERAKAFDEIFR